jgi:hypothetical protein
VGRYAEALEAEETYGEVGTATVDSSQLFHLTTGSSALVVLFRCVPSTWHSVRYLIRISSAERKRRCLQRGQDGAFTQHAAVVPQGRQWPHGLLTHAALLYKHLYQQHFNSCPARFQLHSSTCTIIPTNERQRDTSTYFLFLVYSDHSGRGVSRARLGFCFSWSH